MPPKPRVKQTTKKSTKIDKKPILSANPYTTQKKKNTPQPIELAIRQFLQFLQNEQPRTSTGLESDLS